jgi:glycosyltransferase involved in cell wall biosynthesis
MPTKNRRIFISQSIKYFQKQNYPNKELIIYDTGTDKVKDLIPNSKEIHYFSSDSDLKLGEVRNAAIDHSNGDIIITWEDDDWSAENRISKQIQPIISNIVKPDFET